MDAAELSDDENWRGGYYELAIDLGPRTPGSDDDDRLGNALASVWADPQLDGCYLDRRRRRSDQDKVPPALGDPAEPRNLYGVARLPNGRTVVCSTTIVREIDDGLSRPHDWIDLCLPTGALGRADARVGGYPFADDARSLDWRRPVDSWLFAVACSVFDASPFRVGLIGFEVSGDPATDDVDDEPPGDRWVGYILTARGTPRFYPATR